MVPVGKHRNHLMSFNAADDRFCCTHGLSLPTRAQHSFRLFLPDVNTQKGPFIGLIMGIIGPNSPIAHPNMSVKCAFIMKKGSSREVLHQIANMRDKHRSHALVKAMSQLRYV